MSGRTIFRALLRLEDQKDSGLIYKSDWIRTDMRQIDFVRTMSSRGLTWPKTPDGLLDISEKPKKIILAWLLNAMLVRIGTLNLFLLPFRLFSKEAGANKKGMDRIVIDERNIIAVNGILEHSRDANVVSIWGAAHLPGMITLLRRQGYREDECTWIPAYREQYGFMQQLIEEVKLEREAQTS